MSAVELGTDGWILVLTAVLVALTALLLVAPVIVYWLDSRGFKIRAHADELHRVRVRFNLKGAKSHAIQKVELHAVRAEAIDNLVTRLREHAAHEEAGLYAWAAEHVPPGAVTHLIERSDAAVSDRIASEAAR